MTKRMSKRSRAIRDRLLRDAGGRTLQAIDLASIEIRDLERKLERARRLVDRELRVVSGEVPDA